MPTLNAVQNRCDEWLANRYPEIAVYQATTSFPFQGLSTHTVLPGHVNSGPATAGDINADALGNSPSDQEESWADADMFPVVAFWPCALTINVYEGPDGTGYVVCSQFRYNGDLWMQCVNFGPDTGNDVPWTFVDENAP